MRRFARKASEILDDRRGGIGAAAATCARPDPLLSVLNVVIGTVPQVDPRRQSFICRSFASHGHGLLHPVKGRQIHGGRSAPHWGVPREVVIARNGRPAIGAHVERVALFGQPPTLTLAGFIAGQVLKFGGCQKHSGSPATCSLLRWLGRSSRRYARLLVSNYSVAVAVAVEIGRAHV